jgi:hypothetical protein
MHKKFKKLAMEHQMGRALTASNPAYKRLLEKAVDEQIEQEAARLERLSTSKSKDRNPAGNQWWRSRSAGK